MATNMIVILLCDVRDCDETWSGESFTAAEHDGWSLDLEHDWCPAHALTKVPA